MSEIRDPWSGDLTRDAGDGLLEVYCDLVEQWVCACSCGPHAECSEHLTACVAGEPNVWADVWGKR